MMSLKNSANFRLMFWIFWTMWASLLTWAFFFQIDKAVNVQGTLQPFGKVYAVQSVRDGKVYHAPVKVGDIVSKDDPVLILETDFERITLESYQKRLLKLELQLLRFQTLARQDTYFPTVEGYDRNLWDLERSLFLSELDKLQRDLDLLDKEQALASLKIRNIEEKIQATESQRGLLEKQKALIDSLYAKGYEGELSVLEADLKLQAFLEQMRGMESALQEERTRESMVKRRIDKRLSDFYAVAKTGIYETESELNDLQTSIKEINLRLKQSTLYAPVDGKVSKVMIGNLGHFVAAGESVLEIVPESIPLMLYVNIPSEHISSVAIGQQAKISLSNMDTRNGASVGGLLVQLDGDVTASQAGERFYEGIVSIENIDDEYMVPGVSGSASLLIGTQSVVDYFFEPVIKTLSNSLKE